MLDNAPKDSMIGTIFNRSVFVFWTVCQTKNFTLAAKQLHITQSAVSQSISQLEKKLGIDLFDRSAHRLTLTREAQLFKDSIQEQFADMSLLMENIRTKNFIRPLVRIGIVESFARVAGPSLLSGMLQNGYQVMLHSGTSDYLYQRLLADELDVIVTSRMHQQLSVLCQTFLFSEPHVLVLPSALAQQKSQWSWSDLNFCGIPMVRYTSNTASGVQGEMLLAQAHLNLPTRFCVDDNMIVFSIVAEGMGWSLTQPMCTLMLHHLADRVCVLPAPEKCEDRDIVLVHKVGRNQPLAERLGLLCRELFVTQVIPQITQSMPWTASQLSICSPELTGRQAVVS